MEDFSRGRRKKKTVFSKLGLGSDKDDPDSSAKIGTRPKLNVDKLVSLVHKKDLGNLPEWTAKHVAHVHACFRKEFAIMARKLEILDTPGLSTNDSLGLLTGFFKWLRPLAVAVHQHHEFEELVIFPILRDRLSECGSESENLPTEDDQVRVSLKLNKTLSVENTLDAAHVAKAARSVQHRGAEFLELAVETMNREVKCEYALFERVAKPADFHEVESAFKSFWRKSIGIPKTVAHAYVDRGDAKKDVVKESAEKVKGKAEKVKDHVKEKSEKVKDHTKEHAEKVKEKKDKAKEKVEKVKEHAKGGASKVKDKTKERVDKLKENAKEHATRLKEEILH
mmetsp:Transcript_13752/g.29762  ORF Transcript_13752/g.29762 Transcript_13752/m.29762 type:complete len:338 (+) Transcript_13752:190-1203(+)|eukprot:CAMPEP_0185856014 /NCGR_PEP_ID=MMETSP1354-20130828/27516_1 /TAXON_ID=708628 /ORGANISM="Erythrolobus madagascarensis, Strain CCMP3276" /LENGTH=337 /DNA_ID=CAMNT_0028558153 /DNA_START=121 /DNA_END=1134 /DNA_ORIENTATION=+